MFLGRLPQPLTRPSPRLAFQPSWTWFLSFRYWLPPGRSFPGSGSPFFPEAPPPTPSAMPLPSSPSCEGSAGSRGGGVLPPPRLCFFPDGPSCCATSTTHTFPVSSSELDSVYPTVAAKSPLEHPQTSQIRHMKAQPMIGCPPVCFSPRQVPHPPALPCLVPRLILSNVLDRPLSPDSPKLANCQVPLAVPPNAPGSPPPSASWVPPPHPGQAPPWVFTHLDTFPPRYFKMQI